MTVLLFGRHGCCCRRDLLSVSRPLTHWFLCYFAAQFWALPIYVAAQRGYFADLGLNVTFKTYPSGAPQIADGVENAAWDIGGTGSVPCIFGALADPQIQTIGISNDESAGNALVGNAEGVEMFSDKNLDLASQNVKIAITPNSTGQYAAEECLRSIGQEVSDDLFIFGQQGEALDHLSNGDTPFGGLWAPNTYTAAETIPGASVLCTGKEVDATIPGGIVVRKQFGEEQLPTVKMVLAAWMRSISYIRSQENREQSKEYLRKFYAVSGVVISDEALQEEFNTRPLYGLGTQVALHTTGNLAIMFNNVATFLADKGVLDAVPPTDSYLDSKYMQALIDDPDLSDYAMKDQQNNLGGNMDAEEEPTLSPTSGAKVTATMKSLLVTAMGIFAAMSLFH